MRGAIVLFLLLVLGYLGWYYAPVSLKRDIQFLIGKHMFAILIIAVLCILGLAAAYYTNAIQLL